MRDDATLLVVRDTARVAPLSGGLFLFSVALARHSYNTFNRRVRNFSIALDLKRNCLHKGKYKIPSL